MKKLALMILALGVTTCFAQKDPEAKTLLDKAAKQAAGYKTISAEFDCVYENLAEEKSENYNGTLQLKGNRFRIDIDKTISTNPFKILHPGRETTLQHSSRMIKHRDNPMNEKPLKSISAAKLVQGERNAKFI